ncbi:hypothetical protein SNE40_021833 [Patella caerulea]|uniref:CARD domain-containing protein n=1 Tax=Patella caerulea TaxID=87958 RepID=A0AAN8G0C5_PATCE
MADTRGNLKNAQDERELTDAEEYRRRIEALDERIQQLYDERHRIIEIHRNRKDGIHECAAHQEEERRKHKGYGTREEESFRKAEQEINQDVDNLFGDSRNKLKTIDERIQELEVEDEKTRLRKDWKQRVDSIAEPVKEQRSLVENVGRMPEDQYTNIQSNLPFLVDNLIPDNLIDRLFSKGVFDDDDLEKINKEKENGRRAVVYQMLMILLKCGERAYELFIESLQEEGFIRAVEILENVPQTNTGRVRGRIPQIEYDRLISHYNYLIHTIDPRTLSTRLLTNKVIDQDELEQITNQKLEGRSDVARKLLNILMYCGPGTLDILVRSLREEGCAEIADQLESEKPPPQESKLFKPNEFKNPKLMKAEENGKIMLEMIKANSYPETRAYNEGCKILNNNYILGVIGATGDGKTVLSSMVASNFLENHPDFAPLVIKLSDIDDISFSENRNMLLIMDDILGRFDRSNVNISTLQVNFNNLYLHIKRRKVALIYVIRDYIYNDCNHVRNIYDIFFNEYCIFLHKESLCLNSQERAEIVKYHSNNLQESDIINITENTATSFGFPSIVKLLSKLLSTGKQVEIFTFKSLNEFLSSNFEMFWKEHKDKYACFLLAFIFQPVSVKTLQSGSSSDDQSLVSRIQYDVCENFNMFQALEVFENWSESFYTRDENNCFIFREFVDEAFLIHMLPKFTDLAIKFAPFQLLMEMIRTESDKRTVTSKQCDSIRIEFYPNLADRFINEFRNCNFNVIFHQAFLDERFLLTLVKLAQYNDLMNHYTSIPCGIVGDINDTGNFLHFICLHGSSTCLKTVLSPATETYLKSETENGHNICDLVAISEVDAIAKLDLLAVNYKHLFRNTMLHMAVQSKQLDVVKHVLEYNIFDITTLNRNLQSVLHSACFSIHDAPDIVEFLAIIKGIDINTKDDDGLTPLHYAVKSGKTKTTALLLNLKSDVNMEDKSGRLPIHWGCCSNASLSDVDKAKIVTLLVNQGSDINHKDTDGRTPILEALSNCQTETVEYLLSVECDVNIKDKKGTSVIQEACTNMKQHFTLINDLLKVVNFPVHEAVLWFEDVHKLDKFLDKNIDQINSLNADGELPLHKACISIYKPREKAELLLYKGAHTNLNKHPNVCLFHSTVFRLAPISVMKFLVDIDFNFDIIGDDGETSLMCCCRSGVDQVEKVKFILTNRDTTRTKDGEGQGALHYACLYSQVECVKIMMDKGANVNDIDVNGRSPLFRCIRSKVDRIKKMKLLFSRGADVNAVDKYGNTALYHGVLFNTPDCIRILIECGANVNAVVKYGNTVLHDCAMHNTPECIRILIECGADVNAVNRDGRTALHYGVRYNTPECMRILIEGRADVNAVDRYGNTALHGGVIGNTPDCIRILIEGGANVNAVNHDGNTALHDGVKHNRKDCIRILIEGGADVNAVDHDGNTALHHGVRHNSTECIRILIECGADVNAVGKYGETALHLGVRHNKTDCIRILIECGADVNAVNHDGKTALHHGVIDKTPDCMRILIEGRANVNAVDHDGNTALHHCIIEGNVTNLQILNELEVRVNMKNKDGNKPIYYCCETRTDPVEKLKLLLNAGAELNYWTKRKMRRHKKTSPELKQYLKTL